ncbi:MAG: sigma-70 family RNA polymerase sigma factor [Gemmataceae bacterium]|nr:sigma-70 family RNA polymerase sigma factor [Gemmataceae bacterium]
MAQALTKTVARLRELAARPFPGERTDRQLLEAFTGRGDESAFSLLVHRHGALVLGVCRRVLANDADAEDAFQATFLVLARKAGRVAWHDSVRNWLYGVAYRIARKARVLQARRARKEREACPAANAANAPAANASSLESAWAELRGVLDEELHNLPAKYRAPLLLCCLDGKTREEAAAELGWSVGSVKGRLERGRDLLRERLRGRGLTLSAALCAGILAEAPVSAALVETTAGAAIPYAAGNVAAAASPVAIQLAQGALQAMLIAKCKITGLVLALTCAVGVGGSVAVHDAWAERPAPSAATSAAAAPAAPVLESLDLAMLDPQPISFQDREPPREGEPRQEKERPRDGDRKPEKERPRDGDRRPERAAIGIVKKIDLKIGTITIQSLRDGDTGDKTLNLAGKDVRVSANVERPVTLNDVREGVRVVLSLNDNNDVSAIRVEFRRDAGRDRPAPREGERDGERGRLGGVIVEIDAAKGTIGLLVGREGNLNITTLTVAKDARVRLMHGERPLSELTFAQLAKPAQAWVTLGADQKSVTALDVMAPVLRLRVKAVDAAGRKVTFAAERMEQTFEFAPDAKVMRGRNEVELKDLDVGAVVMISLSPDRRRVIAATMIGGDGDRER